MPIFEYSCTACGHRFEKLQVSAPSPSVVCPSCGSGEVKKELSTFAAAASSSVAGCYSGG
ncbi:FmdB family zinc ribbon protein [Oryzomonas rubra]|uniref:Zinc ribbon domain-containing protein n=1 Tax=Oryzomonas rubra TaxID=2509454 RepID=A0A5A9X5Y8_9BACT|nr:zinc ribbon domain-containing protein [Oryzomonas rubra]